MDTFPTKDYKTGCRAIAQRCQAQPSGDTNKKIAKVSGHIINKLNNNNEKELFTKI